MQYMRGRRAHHDQSLDAETTVHLCTKILWSESTSMFWLSSLDLTGLHFAILHPKCRVLSLIGMHLTRSQSCISVAAPTVFLTLVALRFAFTQYYISVAGG